MSFIEGAAKTFHPVADAASTAVEEGVYLPGNLGLMIYNYRKDHVLSI